MRWTGSSRNTQLKAEFVANVSHDLKTPVSVIRMFGETHERFPTTRTVDTYILSLRRKLEADPDRPRWVLTVHGQCYRLVAG